VTIPQHDRSAGRKIERGPREGIAVYDVALDDVVQSGLQILAVEARIIDQGLPRIEQLSAVTDPAVPQPATSDQPVRSMGLAPAL